jgi:hypothetical protein
MSAMRDMSKAIRHELQEHGETLRDIPRETLDQFIQIVGAFYLDLKGEADRRDTEGE